jgi:hypothetical protein
MRNNDTVFIVWCECSKVFIVRCCQGKERTVRSFILLIIRSCFDDKNNCLRLSFENEKEVYEISIILFAQT